MDYVIGILIPSCREHRVARGWSRVVLSNCPDPTSHLETRRLEPAGAGGGEGGKDVTYSRQSGERAEVVQALATPLPPHQLLPSSTGLRCRRRCWPVSSPKTRAGKGWTRGDVSHGAGKREGGVRHGRCMAGPLLSLPPRENHGLRWQVQGGTGTRPCPRPSTPVPAHNLPRLTRGSLCLPGVC